MVANVYVNHGSRPLGRKCCCSCRHLTKKKKKRQTEHNWGYLNSVKANKITNGKQRTGDGKREEPKEEISVNSVYVCLRVYEGERSLGGKRRQSIFTNVNA